MFCYNLSCRCDGFTTITKKKIIVSEFEDVEEDALLKDVSFADAVS